MCDHQRYNYLITENDGICSLMRKKGNIGLHDMQKYAVCFLCFVFVPFLTPNNRWLQPFCLFLFKEKKEIKTRNYISIR